MLNRLVATIPVQGLIADKEGCAEIKVSLEVDENGTVGVGY